MGHALNKIYKDILAKSLRMRGEHVRWKLTWDCHGLPIELKTPFSDTSRFLSACHETASHWQKVQADGFKKLGIIADWDDISRTDSPSYQASILRSFARIQEQGRVKRKLKPVPWCASCMTVLAHAEVSHKKVDVPALFLLFPLLSIASPPSFLVGEKDVAFVVFTTSPWSLPMNRAVAVNPRVDYLFIETPYTDFICILARDCFSRLCPTFGWEEGKIVELGVVSGEELLTFGMTVRNPINNTIESIVVGSKRVSSKQGSAVLHVAPSCCEDDYVIGRRFELPIVGHLDEEGRFLHDESFPRLAGILFYEANDIALEMLRNKNLVLHLGDSKSTVPTCDRCNSRLFCRSIPNWFIDLKRDDNVIERCISAVQRLSFTPSNTKKRFLACLKSRPPEWCISRQRRWGVPIPSLLCQKCGEAWTDSKFTLQIAEKVQNASVSFWHDTSISQFQELGFLPSSFTCSICGGEDWKKEMDILDIWFDSATSHIALFGEDGDPSDIVIEGNDQWRGWFQSSLLCGMMIKDQVPFKHLVSHGFVISKERKKLSKRDGVDKEYDPLHFSTGVLRAWVSSLKPGKDVVWSQSIFQVKRKEYVYIRSTLWYMLANLSDFSSRHQVPLENLSFVDRFVLHRLHQLNEKCVVAYEKQEFHSILFLVTKLLQDVMRNFYLLYAKSTLYFEPPNSPKRRNAQTVLYRVLVVLCHLLAPILSFLSEEVFEALSDNPNDSIHLHKFEKTTGTLSPQELQTVISFEKLRVLVAKHLQKYSSSNSHLAIKISITSASDAKNIDSFLSTISCKDVWIAQYLGGVSSCEVILDKCEQASKNGKKRKEVADITISLAEGEPCDRCDFIRPEVNGGLCNLCKIQISRFNAI